MLDIVCNANQQPTAMSSAHMKQYGHIQCIYYVHKGPMPADLVCGRSCTKQNLKRKPSPPPLHPHRYFNRNYEHMIGLSFANMYPPPPPFSSFFPVTFTIIEKERERENRRDRKANIEAATVAHSQNNSQDTTFLLLHNSTWCACQSTLVLRNEN